MTHPTPHKSEKPSQGTKRKIEFYKRSPKDKLRAARPFAPSSTIQEIEKKLNDILWDHPVAISSYRGKVTSSKNRNVKQILALFLKDRKRMIQRFEEIIPDRRDETGIYPKVSEGWNKCRNKIRHELQRLKEEV